MDLHGKNHMVEGCFLIEPYIKPTGCPLLLQWRTETGVMVLGIVI